MKTRAACSRTEIVRLAHIHGHRGVDSFCPQVVQQWLLSSPSRSCWNAEAPRLPPHCFAAISHLGIIFCHQTPGTRDGVNAEFDKCSFLQCASFSQPVCARPLPRDSSSARSCSPDCSCSSPERSSRSPKLAQLPPACPGPALHSLLPLWTVGMTVGIPVPAAMAAGHSLH